jgi:hypothetical protein
VALCQARTSTKPLWGLTSSNPYHSQSRAEQYVQRKVFLAHPKLYFLFLERKENISQPSKVKNGRFSIYVNM